jgi:nuclease HARBI1
MSNFLLLLLNEINSDLRKERRLKDRLNPLEIYSDLECIQRFRFDRQGIVEICELIKSDIQRPTKRVKALPPILIICTALRFYAQGAFYRATGDCLSLSKSSQSRCVYEVSKALTKRVKHFIKFPKTDSELNKIKHEFYLIKDMPNCIDAIDGTHICIKTPNKDIEWDYINRKNRHSINVQAVCNANLEFINIVVKYPGRVHDSFIWNNCELKYYFDNNVINGWLLGDSGYPLETNLMTPLLNTRTDAENRYNISYNKTRNVIERAFGLLK